MDPKDTAQAETATEPTTESTATPQATDSTVEPEKEQLAEQQAQPAEDVETLRKELQKLEMERNLLRNKEEERKRQAEEARKADLSEAERLREELEEYKNKEAQQEAERFRNKVIEDHLKDDPEKLKAVKALLDKNLVSVGWENAETEEEARAEVISQLDGLSEVLGTVARPAEEPSPNINPNNPAPGSSSEPDRQALLDEAAKTKDFSKLLQTLPSVQEQINKVRGE